MITEDYVSFKTAKLLKDKGFDELCSKKYNGNKSIVPAGKNIELWQNSEFDVDDECSAPTLQMAMKWLREVHNWNVVIRKSHTIYGYDIYIESLVASNVIECAFEKTYEQACEAGIKYCLENLI